MCIFVKPPRPSVRLYAPVKVEMTRQNGRGSSGHSGDERGPAACGQTQLPVPVTLRSVQTNLAVYARG
jgi:hypothetical protein